MITQRELRKLHTARILASKLAQAPAVREYQAAEKDAAEQLAALRKRYEAREEVETGRFTIVRDVKQSIRVSYEKVLTAFKQVPAIAQALSKCPEAQQILDLVDQRSAASPFVSTSNSVSFDVVPTG